MMLSKGTCCCILHLLHRVGSTNLFAYRNVIKKVDNTCVRYEGPGASNFLFLSLFLLHHLCNKQNRGKHFLVTLSVFPSGMKKVASSLLLVRGNAKLEMEEGEKKNKSAKRKQGKSIRRMFLLLRNVFSKGGRFVLDCLPWRTGIYAGRHEKKYFFVA